MFLPESLEKVYVPPEVYVPPPDNLRLAATTSMYLEEFNLFLHYKQKKYLGMLMEMAV